jgi:hypothetical protein
VRDGQRERSKTTGLPARARSMTRDATSGGGRLGVSTLRTATDSHCGKAANGPVSLPPVSGRRRVRRIGHGRGRLRGRRRSPALALSQAGPWCCPSTGWSNGGRSGPLRADQRGPVTERTPSSKSRPPPIGSRSMRTAGPRLCRAASSARTAANVLAPTPPLPPTTPTTGQGSISSANRAGGPAGALGDNLWTTARPVDDGIDGSRHAATSVAPLRLPDADCQSPPYRQQA